MEEWRPVIVEKDGVLYDYTGFYEVSNKGRVRSLSYNKTGKVQILKLSKSKDGYSTVAFRTYERFKVHRLVATAFIPNPNNLPEVNHLNKNRTDNRVENLEWCTRQQNVEHSQNKKVRCIETGQVFDSIKKAEQTFGIGKGCISLCLTGRQKTAGGFHWQYVQEDD